MPPPSLSTEFSVGPLLDANGTEQDQLRASQDGASVMVEYHGQFAEAGVRGRLYSISTALTGATVVAGWVAPPAAAAATMLSVLNPISSGTNLSVLQGWCVQQSGTLWIQGTFYWCGCNPGVSITAAEATALKRGCFVGQDLPPFKAWAATALTGGVVHYVVRTFPFASTGNGPTGREERFMNTDYVDGSIVVPPGGLITLATAGVGSSTIVSGGMMVAAVPVPE